MYILINHKIKYITILFIFFFYSLVSCGMEKPSINTEGSAKIGKVEINEAFLRQVAITIFKRQQQMEDIKEKMCTHGPQMLEAWKLNKTWGDLDPLTKESLQKIIPTNEIKSILRRPRYALLNPEIIAHPEQFEEMIMTGHITLDKSPDRDTYGIKIRQDFSPKVLGIAYNKDKLTGKIEEQLSTRLYITFDIQDIAEKILTHGIDGWNTKTDGRLTTICIE